ncbi:MAG: hypothetical protein KAI70_01215 [Candidatus Omnitrophica bacterium]|nr:hypothetical protein [Candidatus Omnitrophota bacterium]
MREKSEPINERARGQVDAVVMCDDGYGLFLSPCKNCYKRSVASKGPVARKGYYCKDLIWDSRGLWSAGNGFEDEGAKKRGKCENQFIVKEA